MVSLNNRLKSNCDLTVRALTEIGYGGLIERQYEFPDYFSTHVPTKVAEAVAFGQTPHSYDNACFAVVVANGTSGRELISNYRALAAQTHPRAKLEVQEDADSSLARWSPSRRILVLTETYTPENLLDAFRKNEQFWKPDEVPATQEFLPRSSPTRFRRSEN